MLCTLCKKYFAHKSSNLCISCVRSEHNADPYRYRVGKFENEEYAQPPLYDMTRLVKTCQRCGCQHKTNNYFFCQTCKVVVNHEASGHATEDMCYVG